MMKIVSKNIVALTLWLAICYLAAWIGAQVSPGIGPSDWYNTIEKPSWNPPNWLFGPVWSLLYTTMGIAAWIVWKEHRWTNAGRALNFFLIQLALNTGWSWVFFGAQSPGWALIHIIVLLAAIVYTTILFFEKSKISGYLMIPYILWVSFATVLNGAIWWLN